MSGLAFTITPGTLKANNLDDKDPIKSLRLESHNKKSEILCREIKYSIQKLLMYPSIYTHIGTLCISSGKCVHTHTVTLFGGTCFAQKFITTYIFS